MEDSAFKQKYQKYKRRVKLWEKDFKKKHGRIPSKYDIREASQEIRDSYKMYYKLKTSFLETTLNDVLSDDGFDILEMSQKEVNGNKCLTESITGGLQLPVNISSLIEQRLDDQTPQENCTDLPADFVQRYFANETHVLTKYEPVKQLPLNNDACEPKSGIKINKDHPSKNVKQNVIEKLFKNSSFVKRNPRKSFSKPSMDSLPVHQSCGNDTLNTSNKEVLPDLETILLQKAKEQQYATVISNSLLTVEKLKENIKTHVDDGWLKRNTLQHDINPKASVTNTEGNKDQSLTMTRKKSVYGLTNFDVSTLQSKQMSITERPITRQDLNQQKSKSNLEYESTKLEQVEKFDAKPKSHDSDSVVDDSEEEKESHEHRHIVKRRTLLHQEERNVYRTEINKSLSDFHNAVRNEESREDKVNDKLFCKARSTKSLKKEATARSVKRTASSNNKIRHKCKNTRAFKNEVTEYEELPDDQNEDKPLDPEDIKYTLALERGDLTSVPRITQADLENVDSLAEKYICSLGPKKSGLPSSQPILTTAAEEKRTEARRKLEQKIASGKLNENFVSINIQKKIYTRGKKKVNYSKYKKKLWKHKKHIATLSGPNMDMRGCDGGTLKCFNCGEAGHFAQNCKLKTDSLLPLTVQLENEESAFPTLEEAERMASQTAVAVHSRSIGKMPQAPNVAIYNQTKYSDGDEDKLEVSTFDRATTKATSSDENPLKEYLIESDEELDNFDVESLTLESQKVISPIKKYIGSKIPDEFLKAAGINPNNPNSNNSIQFGDLDPLYDLNSDGTVKEVTSEVLKALRMFGHADFRKGQDRAVMRILSGISTLVTLSTGSGKSLCYQLPAYLYSKHKKSITLVISPLVSLMEDQVVGVPHFLRAHCLHTNQTPQQKVKIMKIIADGDIDVLLVSPEAVVAGERSTGFGSILRQLPPIAFACIDEAHCVSQWSHNFRPSYLMICKVLQQNLGVKCVLGLTATATLPTRISIINHLDIRDGESGVISDIPLPDNLILSVSRDENRDSALLGLLLSKRFETCQSIIIYCTRRDECERIAGYLRTSLQDCKAVGGSEQRKRKRVNWHAEPYHAGMPASRRRTIQNAFMSNELRIVVATVAFGMGINKSDIRAVIHYNMPRNFETYVQEVGRAGRDNKISHCHLFLDANGGDQNELRRHIYANSLDRHVIRKLLQRIFLPCSCDKHLKDGILNCSENHNKRVRKLDLLDASTLDSDSIFKVRPHLCQGHEIGFSIEQTVQVLDIPEENISTLLCYMELDNRWCINVLSNAYMRAKVISYRGPKYLKCAAKECPPLAMAIAMEIRNGRFKEDSNIIEFSVIDIAAAIGWNSGVVKYQLKNLEWVQVNGYSKRSPITVGFYDLGFRIKAPGDFTSDEIDDALDTLYNRSVKQEQTQLIQLQYIFQGLSSVAYNTYLHCCNERFSHDRSNQLKGIIRDYFRNDYPKNLKLQIAPSNVSDAELESDVISLINMYPENNFSGRNIARMFHGISSPNYPAMMWYRCKFWRVHSKIDFNRIVQLANNVIVRRRI